MVRQLQGRQRRALVPQVPVQAPEEARSEQLVAQQREVVRLLEQVQVLAPVPARQGQQEQDEFPLVPAQLPSAEALMEVALALRQQVPRVRRRIRDHQVVEMRDPHQT